MRHLWSAALARLDDDEGLRLRVWCDTYGLAELPWEYAHITPPDLAGERPGPEGFLVLNRRISLVRYEPREGTHTSLGTGVGVIRLVALLASPTDRRFAPLDLDAERRNISAAVSDLPGVRAEFVPDATADALLGALATPAQVFHFAGHGVFTGTPGARYGSQEGESAVVLVDDDGGARLVPAAQLAMMLAGRGVRLAVLTACDVGQRDAVNSWSGVVTALTRVGIPAVVGMQFPVRDAAAVAFSRAFYRSLAAGQSVDGAVVDGRLAVVARCGDASRDWGVPVLYLRPEDGVLFPRGDGSTTPATTSRVATPPPPPPPAPGLGRGGAASSGGEGKPVNKRALREAIVGSFTTEDLMLLCEDIEAALEADGITLQVNLDMVGGGSKAVQVLRLIE
ncbi:MAG: CHAT domain-containing protein, partial [Actinomycetota bacterium]